MDNDTYYKTVLWVFLALGLFGGWAKQWREEKEWQDERKKWPSREEYLSPPTKKNIDDDEDDEDEN